MTDKTEETVADTPNETTETAPAVASDPAGESTQVEEPGLEELLAEFDSTAADTTPQPADKTAAKTEDTNDDDARIKHLVEQEMAKADAVRQSEEDANALAKAVKGEVEVDLDLVKGWLDNKAAKDERLTKAWLARDRSPKDWAKVQAQLARDFQKMFSGNVDAKASSDVDAAMAAVGSAPAPSGDTGDTPKYGSMNDAEFRAEAAKYGVPV